MHYQSNHVRCVGAVTGSWVPTEALHISVRHRC